MEGICPLCRARLDLPVSGTYQCGSCTALLAVDLEAEPPRVELLPQPAGTPPVPPFPAPEPQPYPHSHVPSQLQPQFQPQFQPPQMVADPSLQAPCAGHPQNAAVTLCERCGDFMCTLCATPIEGRVYCPRCFDLLYQRGSLQLAHRQFVLPGITLGLGLTSFVIGIFAFLSCTAFISIPAGIFGAVSGARALKEHAQRPDLPGRGMTLTGLGLSIAGIVVTVVEVVAFWWLILKAR